MKKERYEIRFSGSGGQGIITAGLILAEACGVYEGKYVCQTQSYGPEARGGASRSEVVISNNIIDYPRAISPDLLLAMNQSSCDAYFWDISPSGLLVVDSMLVKQIPTSRVVALPFTDIAKEKTGKDLAANMVALGTVGYLSNMVSIKALERAVAARMPKGSQKANLKALRAGIDSARKVALDALPPSVMQEEEEV